MQYDAILQQMKGELENLLARNKDLEEKYTITDHKLQRSERQIQEQQSDFGNEKTSFERRIDILIEEKEDLSKEVDFKLQRIKDSGMDLEVLKTEKIKLESMVNNSYTSSKRMADVEHDLRSKLDEA